MKRISFFVFLLYSVCLAACQKEISNGTDTNGSTDTTDNNNPDPPDSPDNYTYYYQANIDGVNYFAEVTDNNGYEAGSGMSGVELRVSRHLFFA